MGTADATIAVLLRDVQRSLDGIEARPCLYARHPDTLEALVGTLVTTRQVLAGYESWDPFESWCHFIESINGEPNNRPLWCCLRDADMLGGRDYGHSTATPFGELPRLLGDYARWVAREWPPIATKDAA